MTDAQTTESARKPRAEVAEKSYVDSTGADCEIALAVGYRYTSLPDKTTVKLMIPGATAGTPQTMLACFGASTLGTNTASQNRSRSAEDAFATDAEAVESRFNAIEQDNWGTTGGGGPRINIDVLYDAVVESNNGKTPTSGEAAWKAAKSADLTAAKGIRDHSKIAPIYARLMAERRKPAADEASVDSLLD